MFKVTAVVLACCIVIIHANPLGAPTEDEENDNITAGTLERILTEAEIHLKVKSIEDVKKQVVSGVRYIVDFVSGDNHRCEATWVVQSWESQKPQGVHASCK